jgi:hypothetical protein
MAPYAVTGPELREWRRRRGWTRAEMAAVAKTTLKKAKTERLTSRGKPYIMKTLLAVTAMIALAAPASVAMFSSGAIAASPYGTTVTAPGPEITDIDGNVWQITPEGQIAENGVTDPITQQLETLLFYNNAVYQNAAGPYWWKWENDAWVQVSGDPRIEETLTVQSLTDVIQFPGCCIGSDPYNDLTPFSHLPFGSKTYKGVFVGALLPGGVGAPFEPPAPEPMDGRALASVNFGANQVSISFSFDSGTLSGAICCAANSLPGARFTANTPRGISANGSFIGKNAEELFGIFTGHFGGGTGPSFSGTFTLVEDVENVATE